MNSELQKRDEKVFGPQSSSVAVVDGHIPKRLEALGMMSAGIVHDLGNIIQILSGSIELLDRHPVIKTSASLRPPMRRAVNSVARASALIAQILSFARGGATEHESVDLKQCLTDLKPLLRWISNNRMRLEIRVDADVPAVACNRAGLENAILNLALNARDAMPGRGTLSITAAARRNGHIVTEVAIRVSDTGQGMSSQIMARVLEPFFTTKPPQAGSGLGLPMVRRFAEEAGGDVILESSPGQGTTVTLLLPLRPSLRER